MCQNVDCMISANVALTKFGNVLKEAVVAEWLRRLTRNQFPSGSVGSSPTDCEKVLFAIFEWDWDNKQTLHGSSEALQFT